MKSVSQIKNKQIKKSVIWRITYYKLLFPVIYLYLVTLLGFFYDFSCFLGVGVNLISHSAFSFGTIF